MTVKLNAPVRTPEGKITTIKELDRQGLIKWEVSHNFYTRRGGPFTKYFAVLPSGECWEIGKLAYLSRTGQKVNFNDRRTEEENFQRVDPETLQEVKDVWGDVHYIPKEYSATRLVRTYHADGRRVVECHRNGNTFTYHQIMLHPQNIV